MSETLEQHEMTIDRELLEMAAKAVGIAVIQPHKIGPVDDPAIDYGGFEIDGKRVYWNPLTDDGDALRLAVKLNMDVTSDEFSGDTVVLCSSGVGHAFKPITELHNNDRYAATRRAIVRAAAEIGKEMP